MRQAGETECKYTGRGVYELERPRWDSALNLKSGCGCAPSGRGLASKEA